MKTKDTIGLIKASLQGSLDGIELDNDREVIEKSYVISIIKDLLGIIKKHGSDSAVMAEKEFDESINKHFETIEAMAEAQIMAEKESEMCPTCGDHGAIGMTADPDSGISCPDCQQIHNIRI